MNVDNTLPGEIMRQNTAPPLLSRLETNNVDISKDEIISDTTLAVCKYIIYTIACLTIDICGTVANILNIICFVKQGFKDPVNVSLLGVTLHMPLQFGLFSVSFFGNSAYGAGSTKIVLWRLCLAISDLGSLVPLIWTNICLTPSLSDADLPFEPVGVQAVTGTWPHVTFTRITAWMTALITLERCLCVTAPLQVKNLITPKRVAVITACVFIILIASMTPIYVVYRLEMTYVPAKNKTIFGLVYAANREIIEPISSMFNSIFVSFSAFIVIIVCTTILVIKLGSNTKWRNVTTTGAKADNVSSRNQKVSKMVVMISTLFLACFVPIVIIIVATIGETEISITGKYKNIALLLAGLGFFLESVNSSMNIFIYYHMSSKYRDTFRQLFCFDKVT